MSCLTSYKPELFNVNINGTALFMSTFPSYPVAWLVYLKSRYAFLVYTQNTSKNISPEYLEYTLFPLLYEL